MEMRFISQPLILARISDISVTFSPVGVILAEMPLNPRADAEQMSSASS